MQRRVRGPWSRIRGNSKPESSSPRIELRAPRRMFCTCFAWSCVGSFWRKTVGVDITSDRINREVVLSIITSCVDAFFGQIYPRLDVVMAFAPIMYGAISQILRKFSFGLNSNFIWKRNVVVVHFISLRQVGFGCRNRTKRFPPLRWPSNRRVRHLHGTICTVSWKKKRGPRD